MKIENNSKIAFLNTSVKPLNTDKLRINATFRQQMVFFGHFGPNFVPILEKKCFLARTVAVSFGLRMFSSIFRWGMRTIPNFDLTVHGSSRFSAQACRFH